MNNLRKISTIQCPICKGRDFRLSELHSGSVDRDFNGGVWDGDSEVNMGSPVGKVIASCHNDTCRHTWVLRGIDSFNQLDCDKQIERQNAHWDV